MYKCKQNNFVFIKEHFLCVFCKNNNFEFGLGRKKQKIISQSARSVSYRRENTWIIRQRFFVFVSVTDVIVLASDIGGSQRILYRIKHLFSGRSDVKQGGF